MCPFRGEKLGPHLTQCCLGRGYLCTNYIKVASWSLQPFGHNSHGPENGWSCCAPFRGELGLHLTQCRLGRRLPLYHVTSWSMQPFRHNKHRPWFTDAGFVHRPWKLGLLRPFPWGSCSQFNTMRPAGPWPTSLPSDVLIHPTVWPQYTNVADKRQKDRQRSHNNSIGQTVLETVDQKLLGLCQ